MNQERVFILDNGDRFTIEQFSKRFCKTVERAKYLLELCAPNISQFDKTRANPNCFDRRDKREELLNRAPGIGAAESVSKMLELKDEPVEEEQEPEPDPDPNEDDVPAETVPIAEEEEPEPEEVEELSEEDAPSNETVQPEGPNLGDLNRALYASLERLSDADLQGERIKEEIELARAVTGIAGKIIDTGRLVFEVEKMRREPGQNKLLPIPPALEAIPVKE